MTISEFEKYVIEKVHTELKNAHHYSFIKMVKARSVYKGYVFDSVEHPIYDIFVDVYLYDLLSFPPEFNNSMKTFGFRVWGNLDSSDAFIESDIKEMVDYIRADLLNAGMHEWPLWVDDRCLISRNINNLSLCIDKLAVEIFNKDSAYLNKEQKWFCLQVAIKKHITSDVELFSILSEYVKEEGHFPWRKTNLYSTYEYAQKINFISPDVQELINDLQNGCRINFAKSCLDKLKNFCVTNKRWFYESDNEMVKCFNYICHYYRYNIYNESDVAEIDKLFKTYAGNESAGELAVNTYLVKLGYSIQKQVTFDDCRDKNKLPFDTGFTIGERLCLIEFDGIQHFQPIAHFGGEEHFRYTQYHDNIKNEYCEKNNIPLLRIKYNEIENIESLIDNFIKSVA